MKTLFDAYDTDRDMERDGIEVEYALDEENSVVFQVARAGGSNKRYTKALKRLFMPYRRQVQTETLPEEKGRELLMEAFIEGCLRNWWTEHTPTGKRRDTVDGRDGKPLKLTPANAKALFNGLPDVYSDLEEQAKKQALYRQVEMEEDAKNSGQSSAST